MTTTTHPRTIVCPTDFSELSMSSVEAAGSLAVLFAVPLHLVHVLHSVVATAGPMGVMVAEFEKLEKQMLETAQARMDDVIERHVPEGVEVHKEVRLGNPADVITGYAESIEADLIVISTHGETGWRRFLHGSVTEKVVRLASCAVLVLPSDPPSEEPDKG